MYLLHTFIILQMSCHIIIFERKRYIIFIYIIIVIVKYHF